MVESQKNEKGRLQEWTNHLRSEGFKHIAYVTSDFSWKEDMQELQGDLFWFPSLALEQFSDQAKKRSYSCTYKKYNGDVGREMGKLIINRKFLLL